MLQEWRFADLSTLINPLSSIQEDFKDVSIDMVFTDEMVVVLRVQIFEDVLQSQSLYECLSFIRKILGDLELRKKGYLVRKEVQ